MKAIELIGVSKAYPHATGGRAALDDVSLAVEQGTSLGLIGESGSGKTTIAKILLGLEPASGGEVVIAGHRIDGRPKGRRARIEHAKRIQIVFQDPYLSLNPRLAVGDAIERTLRLHGVERSGARRRALELLAQVGLGEREGDALPGMLSGGQRQRAAIARALAVGPRVLILDEAVAALDVSVQAQVLNLFNDLREAEGLSYLFITHNLAVVQYVTDEAVVLRQGRVVEHGPTRELLARPTSPYTIELLDSIPRGIPRRHDDAAVAEPAAALTESTRS